MAYRNCKVIESNSREHIFENTKKVKVFELGISETNTNPPSLVKILDFGFCYIS